MSPRRGSKLAAVALAAVTAASCAPETHPVETSIRVDTLATGATVPLEAPVGVAVLPGGRIAVVDARAERVFILSPDGALERTIGRPGAGPAELRRPSAVFLRRDTLAVISPENGRIENFLLDGTAAGSRPLPPHAASETIVLLGGDTMLITTGGRDSALARLVTAGGKGGTRYGSPVVAPSAVWDFAAMKRTIREGRVPGELRNLALPAVGASRDVWLALQSEGRIVRFDAGGSLRGDFVVPDSDLAPLRAAFLSANTDDKRPNVLRPLLLAADAAADESGAWFLLARPDSLPTVLLRMDPAGRMIERVVIPGVRGSWHFAWDAPRRAFYLLNSLEGTVVRARLAGPARAASGG